MTVKSKNKSKTKTKTKFGKGLIIVVVLSILTIAAGVACVAMLSQNKSIVHLFGGSDNVYESARLEKLTINGYAIGDKMTDRIREYLTLDAEFPYYYNEVAFWEEDGKISGLGFYTVGGNNPTSITESNIKYEDRRLVKIEDFEETFGIGEEETDKDGDKTIIYRQGDYKLTVFIHNDTVYNVILRKNID